MKKLTKTLEEVRSHIAELEHHSSDVDSRGLITLRMVMLVIALLAIGGVAYHNYRLSAYNAAYIVAASDLSMLSQRIVKAANLTLRGDPVAFGVLRESHQKFSFDLTRLKNGGELEGVFVPPSPKDVTQPLERLSMTWSNTSRHITQLLAAEKEMVDFGKYLRALAIGTRNGFYIGSERVYAATRDKETQRIIDSLDSAFRDYAKTINAALGGMNDLSVARQALGHILVGDTDLFEATDNLVLAYRRSGSERLIFEIALGALAFLVLVVLALMAKELQTNNRQLSMTLAELQSATEQIIQNEKFVALGSLVAGIAHEVNTPLGISVTAASYLSEITTTLSNTFNAGTMKKSDFVTFTTSCQETTDIILSNLHRAAALIQSFKRIAVDQSDENRQTIMLEQYLKDIIVSLTPRLKTTKIRVNIHCPADLQVRTMPGVLSQILTNLVTNSIMHAFDPGAEGEITISAQKENPGFTLVYADNGKGIPQENLHRVFDPFFTTRRGSGGSGLGLSLVHNIVIRKLKGLIDVSSAPGKGTQFTIRLPDNEEDEQE